MNQTLTSTSEQFNATVDTNVIVIATSDLPAMPSPSIGNGSNPLEEIRVRAETVSTLLKEMMDHGATRHWGIND